MRVGQQAFGHGHWQVRNAGFFNQRTNVSIGLGIGGSLAQENQRTLRAFEQVERTLDRVWRRQLAWGRIDDLDQRFFACLGCHGLREKLGRQVKINTSGTTRNGRANSARDSDADVFSMQNTERCLAQWLGDCELVHLFVVALLQIDNLAFAGSADQDHREAVCCRVCQRSKSVKETGC